MSTTLGLGDSVNCHKLWPNPLYPYDACLVSIRYFVVSTFNKVKIKDQHFIIIILVILVSLSADYKDKDKDLFIDPQEFVVGYSKAPEQPQSSARPICHSHAMTRTGREPATIRIAVYRSSPRYAMKQGLQSNKTKTRLHNFIWCDVTSEWIIIHWLNVCDCWLFQYLQRPRIKV